MGADASVTAGRFSRANRSSTVTANAFLTSAERGGRPGGGRSRRAPGLPEGRGLDHRWPPGGDTYSRIGYAHYGTGAKTAWKRRPESYPAVTLALAKKKGTNAVTVAANISTTGN
jgi:hypothetical protein